MYSDKQCGSIPCPHSNIFPSSISQRPLFPASLDAASSVVSLGRWNVASYAGTDVADFVCFARYKCSDIQLFWQKSFWNCIWTQKPIYPCHWLDFLGLDFADSQPDYSYNVIIKLCSKPFQPFLVQQVTLWACYMNWFFLRQLQTQLAGQFAVFGFDNWWQQRTVSEATETVYC